jgi:hypothetical protein
MNQEHATTKVPWKHFSNGGGSTCLSTYDSQKNWNQCNLSDYGEPKVGTNRTRHFRMIELLHMTNREACVQEIQLYCTNVDYEAFYDISTHFIRFKWVGIDGMTLQRRITWSCDTNRMKNMCRTKTRQIVFASSKKSRIPKRSIEFLHTPFTSASRDLFCSNWPRSRYGWKAFILILLFISLYNESPLPLIINSSNWLRSTFLVALLNALTFLYGTCQRRQSLRLLHQNELRRQSQSKPLLPIFSDLPILCQKHFQYFNFCPLNHPCLRQLQYGFKTLVVAICLQMWTTIGKQRPNLAK